MKEPTKVVQEWTELIKKIVEIVAILVAGWWTYTRFFAGEAPSLEGRADVQASVAWFRQENIQSKCTARFRITVKNIGKTSFDLKRITLRAWLRDHPDEKDEITRFDLERLMNDAGAKGRMSYWCTRIANTTPSQCLDAGLDGGRHPDDCECISQARAIFCPDAGLDRGADTAPYYEGVSHGSIIGHYPPDVTQTDDYIFFIPYTGHEDQLVLFRFTGEATTSGNTTPVPIDEWRWSGNCQVHNDRNPSQNQEPQEAL